MASSPLHTPVFDWYAASARTLPWRSPDASPWGVLVSEIMLQQTPVARVEPVWSEWMRRWPTPADLAESPAGEAVRHWGRLGYPRRALRLHETARALVLRYGGEVPQTLGALRALPGVGTYTAAAVASFAFGQRHAVLDTNVRRVLSRAVTGTEVAGASPTAADYRQAVELLPDTPALSALWAVATMELGALMCTARAPRCPDCPLAEMCAWRLAGSPPAAGASRRPQAFAGTDRQVRGRLLEIVRTSATPVPVADLADAWHLPEQRDRALEGLVVDGLLTLLPGGVVALPGTWPPVEETRTDEAP